MSTRNGTALKAGRPSKARAAAPANVFIEQEKPVRVNFDLSRAEHTKLKVHAAMHGKSIADVLREFVTQLSD
ncbi:chromosome partitioning protein ParB [Paraburkholderia sp. 31.1]|uniref:plasmid partition protein ParG n=1 Tax=Paraburkholderia sp. 31.1 TaxID=2615205 RepID=UPI001654E067|nr:plasmid partition protein ParG [Paraburkholderia sp. 31.1]MBC8725505.1 chromosome partitioning protein ParB [Paraburkholderia sp. 31.1]